MSYTLSDWGVYTEKGEELAGGLKSYAMAFDVACRIAANKDDYRVSYRTFLFRDTVTVVLPKDARKIVIGRLHDFGGGATFRYKYTYSRSTLQREYLNKDRKD